MKTFQTGNRSESRVVLNPSYEDIKTRFIWKKFGCIVELKDGETMVRLGDGLVAVADPENPTRIKVRDLGDKHRFVLLPYVPQKEPYMVLTLARFIELLEGSGLIDRTEEE